MYSQGCHVKYKKNHCLDKCLLHVYGLIFASTTAPGTTGESRLQICQVTNFTRDNLYSELRLQLQKCTHDGFGTPQWAQMLNEQLGIKSFCGLYLHLHSSVEKCKNSFFRVPTQKQGQLMRLLPQQTTWPHCMGGQGVPEAERMAINYKASGTALWEAKPSWAIRVVRMGKEQGSQQPLHCKSSPVKAHSH